MRCRAATTRRDESFRPAFPAPGALGVRAEQEPADDVGVHRARLGDARIPAPPVARVAARLAPHLEWPGGAGEFLAETLARLSRRRTEALFVSLHRADGAYIASLEFEGGAQTIELSLRAIVESALANRASGLLLAHNHPSGDPRPSATDIASTRALAALCRPLDLVLHDHLVIGRIAVVSMHHAGLLVAHREAA